MTIDFIYENGVWLLIGLIAARVWRWFQTRVRRRQFRRFFGVSALDASGVVITVPVLRPISRDHFDPNIEKTIALKTDETGMEVRRPIYEDLLNFRDYQSANEVIKLLRSQGAKAKNISVVPDSESLGNYQEKAPCVICLGSPFVNATIGEILRLAEGRQEELISGNRTSDTLDSYRIGLHRPERLSLGVDETHAIGVIARLPNPARPNDCIVGIWGCRAESTLEAAHYLRAHFKKLGTLAEREKPLIVILAIHGSKLNVVEEMYAATDRLVRRDDTLLSRYLRSDAPGAVQGNASVTGS